MTAPTDIRPPEPPAASLAATLLESVVGDSQTSSRLPPPPAAAAAAATADAAPDSPSKSAMKAKIAAVHQAQRRWSIVRSEAVKQHLLAHIQVSTVSFATNPSSRFTPMRVAKVPHVFMFVFVWFGLVWFLQLFICLFVVFWFSTPVRVCDSDAAFDSHGRPA